ncbi:MAG TPA: FAD-dependent oxidoreductase [Parachlamydiaceae bacterium]|nr:FAD-dependent oxidoreductase [Parachlamydiaceae bacterium]
MRIAILGAGFCGLAAAWFLTQKGNHDITIFDPRGIGKGASGVAAGLLHAYAGSQAKKNIRADEGLAATHRLLKVSETALNEPVIASTGLIRLAVSQKQKEDFANIASLYPDVHWLTVEECQLKLGIEEAHPGIFIDSAVVIDCEKYLQGLWKACTQSNVAFEKKAILSLSELKHFDKILVTMGAAVKSLPELNALKVTPIKGQVLEMQWPPGMPPLRLPISSQAYVLMQNDEKKCISGATYERNFQSEDPDLTTAVEEILPKLQTFLPAMTSSLIVGCRAGVRASAPRHQPLMQKIDEKSWVLTGMGSKGLLYHALYAEEMVSAAVPSL